jgi:hypothetical protein
MAKKTIGTTTLAATGGASVIGIALATLVVKVIPADIGTDGFAALAVVLSALCGLGAGYLAPSKAEALKDYLAPSADEVAQRVAEVAPTAVVPSADEVAEAVANRTSTEGYTGAHAATSDVEQYRPAEAPKATEPGVDVQAVAAPADTSDDAYPDLDSLAKQ